MGPFRGAVFRHGGGARKKAHYPRHQNYYMQLFMFSVINFLKIVITITFFIPSRIDSREM